MPPKESPAMNFIEDLPQYLFYQVCYHLLPRGPKDSLNPVFEFRCASRSIYGFTNDTKLLDVFQNNKYSGMLDFQMIRFTVFILGHIIQYFAIKTLQHYIRNANIRSYKTCKLRRALH